jgi:anti-sigma factor RsiW
MNAAMLCKDASELIEPIASGDLQPDAAARAHFETCPRCASALATARRLETMLKGMDVPLAPANFTAAVVQRIRRDRWRAEQHVDRLFNLAIVFALLLVAGGIAALLNVQAVSALAVSAWAIAKEGLRETMTQAAPTLATYVAAAGLLATAFGMWWWAERRWQY